jgi:MFS family permease
LNTLINKSKSIYYGWYILAAAIVLLTYQSVAFVYGMTAFMTPIATSLGWSYAQISLAATIRGLEVGALDPIAGIVVDRWPARRLMILGTIVFTAGVLLLSRATSLWVFYLAYIIMGLGGTFSFSMVPQTILARWFKKNIGKVSGILSMGFSLGGMFVPFIVTGIQAYGWRDMMMYLAFGTLILGLPLALVFRDRPEDYGLLADGAVPINDKVVHRDPVMGFKQVLKLRAFWLIGLASMLQMLAINALTIHIVPYLGSLGMTSTTAALSVTIFSAVALGIRLLYGFLADVIAKKYLMIFSCGVSAVALVMLSALDGKSFAAMVVFSVVYALGVAGSSAMRVPILRDYFGAGNFGTVFGWISVFTVIGGVTGAPLAGWVYDARGTYFPIWLVFAGLCAVAVVFLLMLPKPAAAKDLNVNTGRKHA